MDRSVAGYEHNLDFLQHLGVQKVVQLLPLLTEFFQTLLIKGRGNLVVTSHLIHMQELAGMRGHWVQFIRGPLVNLRKLELVVGLIVMHSIATLANLSDKGPKHHLPSRILLVFARVVALFFRPVFRIGVAFEANHVDVEGLELLQLCHRFVYRFMQWSAHENFASNRNCRIDNGHTSLCLASTSWTPNWRHIFTCHDRR